MSFVYAAEEVFVIAIVEAQSCGTPVISYGKGGALESVVPLGSPGATGLHFMTQTPASLCEAVERFEDCSHAFTTAACRRNAERFGAADFRRRFIVEVLNAMAKAEPSRDSEVTSVLRVEAGLFWPLIAGCSPYRPMLEARHLRTRISTRFDTRE